MKKFLFFLVILMTAVSSVSARTNNDFSTSSSTVLPATFPGDLVLKSTDGDIIYATVTEGFSFTRINFDRVVYVGTIEFFRRRPLELHNFTVDNMGSAFTFPFVTSAAKWEVTIYTNDGKKYKGSVQLNGPASPDPTPWPEPWIIK